jgi:dipeptidyl-peptidase III
LFKIDQAVHAEVLARYAQYNARPYSGMVNPRLVPDRIKGTGEIENIRVESQADFLQQHLDYSDLYTIKHLF